MINAPALHEIEEYPIPKQSDVLEDTFKGMANMGVILNSNDHSFKSYIDTDFCDLWNSKMAMNNMLISKSRTGFIINYARYGPLM
jgi:hypothetical protein